MFYGRFRERQEGALLCLHGQELPGIVQHIAQAGLNRHEYLAAHYRSVGERKFEIKRLFGRARFVVGAHEFQHRR